MSVHRRSTSLVIASVTALFLATSCGVSGSSEGSDPTSPGGTDGPTSTIVVDDDPDAALNDAVDATLQASAFTISTEANLVIGGQDLRLTAEGPVDYEGPQASVTITVDAPTGDGEVEIRSDGEKVWVRPDGSTDPGLPDGAIWVEGDADRLTESETFDQTGLLGVVLALRAAEDTERLETEEIDGVEVTKYQTTVDYEEAVDAAGADAEAFEAALSLTAPGSVDLLIDVTVGADGIVRTFSLDIDASSAAIDGDYLLEISDVGQSVSGEAPPAEDTLTGSDADDLLDDLLS